MSSVQSAVVSKCSFAGWLLGSGSLVVFVFAFWGGRPQIKCVYLHITSDAIDLDIIKCLLQHLTFHSP